MATRTYHTGVATVYIAVEGEVHTLQIVEGLRTQLGNFEPFFRKSAVPALKRYFRRQFAGEGIGKKQGRWPALSPVYDYWKQKQRPGAKILVFNGTMRDALTGESPHTFTHITKEKLVRGIQGLRYPIYHQSRQPRRGNLPRRMIIDFDDRFHDDLQRGLLEHARKAAMGQRR